MTDASRWFYQASPHTYGILTQGGTRPGANHAGRANIAQ